MKIVILEGSPNKNGSSNLLAESFIRGAEEAGHSVQIIDAAHANIHSCTGCIHCGYEGPCIQKDDMETIRQDHPYNGWPAQPLKGAFTGKA